MIRVVLDTNVILSAHLKETGNEAAVFQLALAGRLAPYISPAILEEYALVLRREKFSFPEHRIVQSLRAIKRASILVSQKLLPGVCPDPDDNKFLECALAASAQYVVTGNLRHFPKTWRGITVVNARTLIELITPDLKGS